MIGIGVYIYEVRDVEAEMVQVTLSGSSHVRRNSRRHFPFFHCWFLSFQSWVMGSRGYGVIIVLGLVVVGVVVVGLGLVLGLGLGLVLVLVLVLNSYYIILILNSNIQFFILHSSFFILHSSFFILHSSF